MARSPADAGPTAARDRYVGGWRATLHLLRRGRSWSGYERNRAFLNCGAGRFANVSALSGLDFADDGRALAVVDWDGDGDLDLWLRNRTGPRLRLLLNRGTGGGERRTVNLELRGTRVNRDAVGARVELRLRGTAAPLVRTVNAGDGFLSQSTRRQHFGLGAGAEVEEVTVRWPGGGSERFTGVAPGELLLLVEGSGAALAAAPARRRPALVAAVQPTAATATARAWLPFRVPLPALPYTPLTGGEPRPVETGAGPLLLNLWASWCAPCVAELEELAGRAAELRAADAQVLALSVDGLDEKALTGAADAARMLDRLRFPFAAGIATPELLDKLELLGGALFDRQLPLAVPTSFLVDPAGRLAATYRGRLEVNQLLADLAALDQPPAARLARAAPLPGRWSRPPPRLDLVTLAEVFQDRYPATTEVYLTAAMGAQPEPGAAELVTIRLGLAEALRRQGRTSEARAALEATLAASPGLARAHLLLGVLLQQEEELVGASRHLQRAVELEPASAAARKHLGLVLLARGEWAEGRAELARSLELEPEDAESHYSLGLAEAHAGRRTSALAHLEESVRLRPDARRALTALARLLTADPGAGEAAWRRAIALAERAGDEELAAALRAGRARGGERGAEPGANPGAGGA